MRTIRISEDVWQEIADRGKFGETPNTVLERVFGIKHEMPIKREVKEMYQMGTMYTLEELEKLELGKDTRPDRFQLDNQIFSVNSWVEVCTHFVKWLISKEYLTPSKCPVPTGSGRREKYFINTKKVHRIPERDGGWKEIGPFFVDMKYNALHHIKNIRESLKHLGVRNPSIRISFSR
jgi:hypothetical protein